MSTSMSCSPSTAAVFVVGAKSGDRSDERTTDAVHVQLTTRQDVYVGHASFDTRTIKYTYSLDGGTLTIDKTDNFQGQTKTTKLVYNKGS